jgi:group II intron reverse transcriptase/maturase
MSKHENVLEKVYEPRRLIEAWQQVKSNAGAAGVDRMSVKDFEERKGELMPIIRNKLMDGSYRFKPVRRVEIPKPGTSKTRNLGIPVITDRIVSTSIQRVFEEIFEGDFTSSNYGFRRGHSQHQAIDYVKKKVEEGYTWCASIDLKGFFDEIPHNLILKLIRRKIADERLVTLIARALKAGVIVDGKFEKTPKGCPQGSPLSPMLSNIVLNEMDQELERRGLTYCRWADDSVILLKSERAAHRVSQGMIKYLEETLNLPVNREKSEVAKFKDITFLGIRISGRRTKISDEAISKFKRRVKLLTRRNNPLSMHQIIAELSRYLRGWINYFRIQQMAGILVDLDVWIRHRLRVMQLRKWKKPKKFQRVMIKAGFDPREALRTWVNMKTWRSAQRKIVCLVLSPEWFRNMGLVFLDDFRPAPLKPIFSC